MRIGVLSLAHVHADGYLAILSGLEGVELVGFSDLEPDRAAAAVERHSVPHLGDHAALLAAGLDGVVICSENAHHREHVELAAAAGVAVLCEKPIATSLDDALAIRRAVEEAGILFTVAFPMRFDTALLAARDQVQQGALGRLYAINGVNHSEIPRAHRAWFADPVLAGGGAAMDHTVHLLDLYRWLLGCEPSEVVAEIGNPLFSDVEVDTAGLITVAFPEDVFALIDCSWSRPEGIYPRWGHLHLELIGERGGIEVDAFAQQLQLYGSAAPRPSSWLGWGDDPNVAMMHAFVESVRSGTPLSIGWRDGYQALAVTLAAYTASERGEPVAIPPPP
jgi:predicted dehydrogenase